MPVSFCWLSNPKCVVVGEFNLVELYGVFVACECRMRKARIVVEYWIAIDSRILMMINHSYNCWLSNIFVAIFVSSGGWISCGCCCCFISCGDCDCELLFAVLVMGLGRLSVNYNAAAAAAAAAALEMSLLQAAASTPAATTTSSPVTDAGSTELNSCANFLEVAPVSILGVAGRHGQYSLRRHDGAAREVFNII